MFIVLLGWYILRYLAIQQSMTKTRVLGGNESGEERLRSCAGDSGPGLSEDPQELLRKAGQRLDLA